MIGRASKPSWWVQNIDQDAITWEYEFETVKRLLDLRRQGKVGIIHAEYGRYAISGSADDIAGSKRSYSLPRLRELVETLEGR